MYHSDTFDNSFSLNDPPNIDRPQDAADISHGWNTD